MSDEYDGKDAPEPEGGHPPVLNVYTGDFTKGDGIPFPPVSAELVETSPFTPEQEARSSALYHARSCLEKRGSGFSGTNVASPPSVDDLLRVATWIIQGWEPIPEPSDG